MMLGSFRFTEPGLPPALVGLPFPDTERRANFRPGGEETLAEDDVRTGPWMGQEVEDIRTG